ncbi:MAG: hypothetical protein ACE364_11525 [Chlorobiota bacterium]
MKNISYLFLMMVMSVSFASAQMQDLSEPEEKLEIQQKADGSLERPQTHDEAMKYFKEIHKEEFDEAYFEDVWNAVVESIEDQGCAMMTKVQKNNDEGFLKGVLKSEFCVFVNDDTTFDLLKIYSVKMPVIRGGIWTSGRIQYKIIIEEINEGEGTSIIIKGELSGSEDNVTNEVHFWESNGWFETDLLYRIKNKLGM